MSSLYPKLRQLKVSLNIAKCPRGGKVTTPPHPPLLRTTDLGYPAHTGAGVVYEYIPGKGHFPPALFTWGPVSCYKERKKKNELF